MSSSQLVQESILSCWIVYVILKQGDLHLSPHASALRISKQAPIIKGDVPTHMTIWTMPNGEFAKKVGLEVLHVFMNGSGAEKH